MAEVELTQGKVALVDDEDLEWLSQWKWHAHQGGGTFYAARHTPRDPKTGEQSTVYMHRVVLDAELGTQVDHINANGLDNQRANLRLCSNAQNHMNQRKRYGTSQWKGVSWQKQHAKWRADIKLNGKKIHLGYSNDEADAARAYDDRARVLFGQYARLNFPRKGEQSARIQ